MTLIQDLTTITAGIGTTGATISIGNGSSPFLLTQINFGGITIFAILILAGVIAHLVDRKLNQKFDLDLELTNQDLNLDQE
jgi:uncharacterized membrane protein